MKNTLVYLCTTLLMLCAFTSCKDEVKPEVPPVVQDIIAAYSADKLKATVDGAAITATDAKVEIAAASSASTVTIKLFNILPGVAQIEVPNATFEAVSKSAFLSKLEGEVIDNVLGYKVKVSGTVDEKILTMAVTLTPVKAENINTTSLHNLVYKGNMAISVAGMPTPVEMEQRIYVAKSSKIGTTQRDTSMVKLTIQNFTFQDLKLGDIKLDTVLVQKRGDVLIFDFKDRKVPIVGIGDVDATLSGTIIGDRVSLDLGIDVATLKVAVKFAGKTIVEKQLAKMESLTVTGPAVVEEPKFTGSTMRFKVWDTTPSEQLLLTPVYKLADGAAIDSVTITVGGISMKLKIDMPIDFSLLKTGKDFVKYHIRAEDPNKKGSALIYMDRIATITPFFDFSQWQVIDNMPEPMGLATSNAASAFFPFLGIPALPYPVSRDTIDGVAQNAAVIQTRMTVSETMPNGMVPAVTAGTLFLGEFKLNAFDPMASTRFGAPFTKKPVSFKFTYNYMAGPAYYKTVTINSINSAELVEGEIDLCSINAYLYEVTSYEEVLTGANINTSEKVIARAILADGGSTSGVISKEIPFVYTGTFSADKKYKLAIVCSSSNEGDQYRGAPGSKLIVSNLEVVTQ